MPETTPNRPIHEAPTDVPGVAPDALGNMGHETPEMPVVSMPISHESIMLSSLGFVSPFEKLAKIDVNLPSLRRDQDGNISLTHEPLTLGDLQGEHARLMQQKSNMDRYQVRMEALKEGAWVGAVVAEQLRLAKDRNEATNEDDEEDYDVMSTTKKTNVVSLAQKRDEKAVTEKQDPVRVTTPSVKVAA